MLSISISNPCIALYFLFSYDIHKQPMYSLFLIQLWYTQAPCNALYFHKQPMYCSLFLIQLWYTQATHVMLSISYSVMIYTSNPCNALYFHKQPMYCSLFLIQLWYTQATHVMLSISISNPCIALYFLFSYDIHKPPM